MDYTKGLGMSSMNIEIARRRSRYSSLQQDTSSHLSVVTPRTSATIQGTATKNRRLRRDLTFAMDRKGIDDEDAHHDVGQRPDRVVGHPPDGADGHHCPGEDTDPSTDL